jgi:tetratricopeptide (TPR) repeat protein
VELFVRRAREVLPAFALTDDNGPAVAEICHRLSGLPLAIGLAAARSKVLTPQMMLDRLDRPLELLTGGPRDAPERQQTMRNAIQWSYDLLDEGEQRLLHVLSVFAGGWTLAAAEEIFAPHGERVASVLDGLTSLVNNSLVIQDSASDRETRFGLLEPVREFGLEQLDAGGDGGSVRERHAQYFTALAMPTNDEIEGPEPRAWLDRLEAEHDNFRAALRWAIGVGLGEPAQRLAGALWGFWAVRGYLTEGQRWLALALDLDQAAVTVARAEALHGAGELAGRQGEFEIAATRLSDSLALYRRLGVQVGIVRVLNGLGLLEMARERLAESSAYFEEGLELALQHGDQRLLARLQHNLGGCAILCGDYERAEQLLTANVELGRSAGNQRSLAYALGNLGVVAHDRGDIERSRLWLEESLSLFRSQGDRAQVALRISQLGQWAYTVRDFALALRWLDESLVMSREMGNRLLITTNLRLHGQVAVELGEPLRAARLFGAAELLRESVSWNKPSPSARAAYEGALRQLASTLDSQALAVAWAAGRSMPLDDAIDYASNHATGARRDGPEP